MFLQIFNTSLMITSFVALMMVIVDYVNVLTRGLWRNHLIANRWGQYLLAGILGATPGCLGAFAVVAIYSHGMISLGALVVAMIATSGDEAFVMLAMFPGKALALMGLLLLIGVLGGWLTDRCVGARVAAEGALCGELELHDLDNCECFVRGEILGQWRHLSLARGVLTAALLLFVVGVVTGSLGHEIWDWKRTTLALSGVVGLFIVVTAPEHFLQEHVWKHVALRHVHHVFLWTFGALLATELLTNRLDMQGLAEANVLVVTLFAGALGLIPESGPHLLVVTLYASGVLPLGVLLTNSIVQDGHGMLPLLAHSRKVFLIVKGINLVIGIAVGIAVHYARIG